MKTRLLLSALVISTFFACKKKIDDPYERITGKWIVDNQQLLGQTFQGDGSYLTFDACASKTGCTGIDYKESDKSTGSFSFVIADDESTITITDTMSAGGSYDGEWDVTLFNNKNLHLKISTFLGDSKIEFTKD